MNPADDPALLRAILDFSTFDRADCGAEWRISEFTGRGCNLNSRSDNACRSNYQLL
jgi:hypothetical protein